MSDELFVAINNGDIQSIKALIEAGGDVNAKNSVYEQGYTALHRASVNGNIDLMRILIEAGADVNARDDDGRTPLHWANIHNKTEVAKLLIEETGADVDARDKWGETPLHIVSSLRYYSVIENIDVAKVLIEHGADINVRNWQDRTPLDLADEYLKQVIREAHASYLKKQINEALDASYTLDDLKNEIASPVHVAQQPHKVEIEQNCKKRKM